MGLTRMATTTSSNWAATRSKMSTWPSVTGSNDPGHTAPLMTDDGSRKRSAGPALQRCGPGSGPEEERGNRNPLPVRQVRLMPQLVWVNESYWRVTGIVCR